MTVDEFVSETLGQWYDMDGVPAGNPYQCADYFKLACQKLLGYHFPCGGDGYVDNWWNEETRKAHSKEFKYVTDWRKLKDGDFVIWGNARRYPETINPLSHIAMYYKGNMVGTNQFGHKEVTSVPVDNSVWENMIGAYRFRSWDEKKEEEKKMDKYVMNGIDISNHQASAGFDISKVSFDFCIIKSTEGIGFVDPFCDQYVQYCIAQDLPWGFYHFGRPGNDPEREADFWVEQTSNYFGHGLPVLDIETTDGNEDVVSWCYRFLSRVIDRTGIKPMVYMSESFDWKYDWSAVVSLDVGLWLAAYRSSTPVYNYQYPSMWKSPVTHHWQFICMWQYTSNGHLEGYSGRLDMDVFYGDREVWQKYVTGGKEAPPAGQTPEEAHSETIPDDLGKDEEDIVIDENEAVSSPENVVEDITKIDWKRKLSSRKFWMAIINLLTAVFIACRMDQTEITQITAIIMASGGLIAYILAEGWIDASREANRDDRD